MCGNGIANDLVNLFEMIENQLKGNIYIFN